MSTVELATTQPGTVLPGITAAFTRGALVRYAGASTDFNPIHWSDRAAADLGLPGVIAHGMLTMGTALRVVTDWCGDPARVLGYFVRFTRPVVVPDTDEGTDIVFTASVTDLADGVAKVAITATCGDEAVLGAAPRLLAGGVRLRLMTGPRHLDAVRERCLALGLPWDSSDFQVTAFIEDMAEAYGWADLVICAWGMHGAMGDRAAVVERMLRGCGLRLYHLGLTKSGAPRHPLYLKRSLKLNLWD